MCSYFSKSGYFHNLKNKNFSLKGPYNRRLNFMQFLELDFKKKVMCFYKLNSILEFYKGLRGANAVIKFQFFRNNMRITVYIERLGFIVFSITGGVASRRVLRVSRVYRRDKRGDGTLLYIGNKIKRRLHRCVRRFFIAKFQLSLSTYFRRYMFFKLIRPFVFKRLRGNVILSIPKGHNSLESEKRWRKKRRK